METLQITNHEGIPILVQKFGNVFMSLVVHKGKFYAMHNVIKLPLWRRIIGSDYTAEELLNATNICLSQAKTTASFLLQNKK